MSSVVNSGMRDFWNNAGGRMWVNYQDIIEIGMSPLGINAMDRLGIAPNDRVLDIGCGCGDTTIELARRVGKDGYVLGVDISEMIISSAKKKINLKKQSHVDFKCLDAQNYDFDKTSFDVIFSRFGVMFFDDPIAAFSNLRASLRSNGHIAFVCWQPVTAIEWISLPLEIISRHIEPPPSPPPQPEAPGGFSFGDANRVERILSSAGYSDINIEPYHSKINIGKSLDEAQAFLTHIGPAGSILENPEIDSEVRMRFIEDLHNTLKAHQTEKGVSLGAATWLVTASNK
jgi:SAM-dependent methyltransferase